MEINPVISKLRLFVNTELGNHLPGYAARAAAQELLESWESALSSGDKGKLADDIDEVIALLHRLKKKARAELPVVNGGLEGKTLEQWKERLAEVGVEVFCSGFASRETSGWRFTGMNGGDYAEATSAVLAAVKRYLPEGGYAFTPLQLARARIHSLATRLGSTGWFLLADTNTFGNVIYLVSEHRDVSVAFECDKPYHDFLRQRAYAEMYACDHPEKPNKIVAAAAELVITPLAVA